MDDGSGLAAGWKSNLSSVLDLITTRSNKIVDDTSLEKLLTWISSIANDEEQRKYLLEPDSGVIKFLSPPFQTIFACPVSANFAIRLAGILAGCCSELCDVLEKRGTLDFMFYDGLQSSALCAVLKVAVVRNAIFEGLSSMLSSESGCNWIKSKDFINTSINAFNDSSFYVIQSAIKFLTKLLPGHVNMEKDLKYLEDSLHKISNAFRNSEHCSQQYYLDLVSQLSDGHLDIAIALLEKLPSFCDIVQEMRLAGRVNASLLQIMTEICGKFVKRSRDFEFPWHCIVATKEDSGINACTAKVDVFMKLALELAEVGPKYVVSFLLRSLYCEEHPARYLSSYWNELLLRIMVDVVLNIQQAGNDCATHQWLTRTLQSSKEYPQPENVLNLLAKLKDIFHEFQKDVKCWKRNFSLVLDSGSLFSKVVYDSCTKDGKLLVESLADFLSDSIAVDTKNALPLTSNSISDLPHVFTKTNGLSSKCSLALKTLISNGVFADFSIDAKIKLVTSLIGVLADESRDGKTVSACISVLTVAAEMPDPAIVCLALSTRDSASASSGTNDNTPICMASVMEALLVSSIWEIQDSVMDFLVALMKTVEENKPFMDFLTANSFWTKAVDMLTAEESYVRASSVRVLCFGVANKDLRRTLKQKISLATLHEKILQVLKSDDEAFAKRSIMDLVSRWLEIPEVMRELLQASTYNEVNSSSPDEASILGMIFLALKIASVDFDWEVKKKGVECWHKILRILIEWSSVGIHLDVKHSRVLDKAAGRKRRFENCGSELRISSFVDNETEFDFSMSTENTQEFNEDSSRFVQDSSQPGQDSIEILQDSPQFSKNSSQLYEASAKFWKGSPKPYFKNSEDFAKVAPNSSQLSEDSSKFCNSSFKDFQDSSKVLKDSSKLNILCSHGGAVILVTALNDCDQLVREAAYSALKYATDHVVHHTDKMAECIFSCHDVEDKFISFNLNEVGGLVEFLKSVNFASLRQSMQLADAKVASYPVSLLNDILAAAMHSDDNLLDCY